ncbi:MAG: hypothetical protein JWN29_3733 [Acidimicrobiales bacterium]|nr:hypothetical protein [Acidimicrobiales bacterium]
MRERLRPRELENDVSVHVFTVSAAMVGVCLTVIGIIQISEHLSTNYTSIADVLLAMNAVCFLAACLLSYRSLRSPSNPRRKVFESYADVLMMAGLVAMTVISVLIAVSFV